MVIMNGRDVRDYDELSETCDNTTNAQSVAQELFIAVSDAPWGITSATNS